MPSKFKCYICDKRIEYENARTYWLENRYNVKCCGYVQVVEGEVFDRLGPDETYLVFFDPMKYRRETSDEQKFK